MVGINSLEQISDNFDFKMTDNHDMKLINGYNDIKCKQNSKK